MRDKLKNRLRIDPIEKLTHNIDNRMFAIVLDDLGVHNNNKIIGKTRITTTEIINRINVKIHEYRF